MPHITTVSVEKDNSELVDDLSKEHQLSKITNQLWRQYQRELNPQKNKYRDIRTESDVDQLLDEQVQINPQKMTPYIVKISKARLMDELKTGAFVLDIDNGQMQKIGV